MTVITWQEMAYYAEKNLRQECTCPTCKVVWQHYNSKAWIKEHFGSAVEPVTCPECGTPSVAGSAKRYKPRKIYVEPGPTPEPTLIPEPALTRSARRRGWFGRAKAPEGAADEYSR